jgi:hypothetical protein
MREFATKKLEMDYLLVEQGLIKEENIYRTTHSQPVACPFKQPFYDFSAEAITQSKVRGVFYLMFSSFYGVYHYAAI